MSSRDNLAAAATVDPRLTAAIELIGRTGSDSFELRYSDDEQPVVWMAIGCWKDKHEVGAALDPVKAALRLLDLVIDGGQCTHCKRPTAVSDDFEGAMPLENAICWYRFDPELATFRRGCEAS